jgi:glutaminyl-tRNA synthetase
LILSHSEKVSAKDIEQELLTKLFSMSLKSQSATVRFFAIQNLKKDFDNLKEFKAQLSEIKNTEKNEKVLELLNGLQL